MMVVGPECEQFGITKEQCNFLYAKKEKIRNYIFGISSAAGILAGCIFGIYLSKGIYETVLFILFFGCFLGSVFGGIFTIIVVALYILLLYQPTEAAESISLHNPKAGTRGKRTKYSRLLRAEGLTSTNFNGKATFFS